MKKTVLDHCFSENNYSGKINYNKEKTTFTFNLTWDDFVDWRVKQTLNSRSKIFKKIEICYQK